MICAKQGKHSYGAKYSKQVTDKHYFLFVQSVRQCSCKDAHQYIGCIRAYGKCKCRDAATQLRDALCAPENQKIFQWM